MYILILRMYACNIINLRMHRPTYMLISADNYINTQEHTSACVVSSDDVDTYVTLIPLQTKDQLQLPSVYPELNASASIAPYRSCTVPTTYTQINSSLYRFCIVWLTQTQHQQWITLALYSYCTVWTAHTQHQQWITLALYSYCTVWTAHTQHQQWITLALHK